MITNKKKVAPAKTTIIAREYSEWYRSHGICLRCHQNEIYKGYFCLECRFDRMEYLQNYHAEQKTAEQKYRNEMHTKKRLEVCEAFGVCVQCQKRDAAEGKKRCEQCLAKNNRQARDRYKKKIGDKLPRSERFEYGLCYFCGKPVVEMKKVCADCLPGLQEHIRKMREKIDKTNHIWRNKK